jgi:hypothetical protein
VTSRCECDVGRVRMAVARDAAVETELLLDDTLARRAAAVRISAQSGWHASLGSRTHHTRRRLIRTITSINRAMTSVRRTMSPRASSRDYFALATDGRNRAPDVTTGDGGCIKRMPRASNCSRMARAVASAYVTPPRWISRFGSDEMSAPAHTCSSRLISRLVNLPLTMTRSNPPVCVDRILAMR